MIIGNYPALPVIDQLTDLLTSLAFAESTQKNMQSHLKAYLSFGSFPLDVFAVSRYVTYLAYIGRRFGTIQNHISSLKHFHQFYGFHSGWEQNYSYKLIIKGLKRYLGMQSNRKQAITPLFLHRMAFFFDLRIPLHAAMWALFLVAFFSFLRKSNLVVENTRSVSSAKVLRRSHLLLRENTASLRIFATKTIQFAQRSLTIPLPVIPGSILCPVAALHTHLNLNQVPASAPLFNRAAMGRARFLLCTGFFFFRFRVTRRRPPRMMSSSTNCLHRMMSSSANYRPFLSSFRHISPSGGFCQVSELTVHTKNGGLRRWASGHLQG